MADRMFTIEGDSVDVERPGHPGHVPPVPDGLQSAAPLLRRLQGRVDRQVRLLDRLRSDPLAPEPPGLPEMLDSARRIRHDAESLLILAGEHIGVPSGGARQLAAVLDEAVDVTEEPLRVDVRRGPSTTILPAAAAELLHIIAELVDHVTSVHPAGRIEVSFRPEPLGGVVVEVRADGATRHDPGHGLGPAAAGRMAQRSGSHIVLRVLPVSGGAVSQGPIVSVHCPGAVVSVDEPGYGVADWPDPLGGRPAEARPSERSPLSGHGDRPVSRVLDQFGPAYSATAPGGEQRAGLRGPLDGRPTTGADVPVGGDQGPFTERLFLDEELSGSGLPNLRLPDLPVLGAPADDVDPDDRTAENSDAVDSTTGDPATRAPGDATSPRGSGGGDDRTTGDPFDVPPARGGLLRADDPPADAPGLPDRRAADPAPGGPIDPLPSRPRPAGADDDRIPVAPSAARDHPVDTDETTAGRPPSPPGRSFAATPWGGPPVGGRRLREPDPWAGPAMPTGTPPGRTPPDDGALGRRLPGDLPAGDRRNGDHRTDGVGRDQPAGGGERVRHEGLNGGSRDSDGPGDGRPSGRPDHDRPGSNGAGNSHPAGASGNGATDGGRAEIRRVGDRRADHGRTDDRPTDDRRTDSRRTDNGGAGGSHTANGHTAHGAAGGDRADGGRAVGGRADGGRAVGGRADGGRAVGGRDGNGRPDAGHGDARRLDAGRPHSSRTGDARAEDGWAGNSRAQDRRPDTGSPDVAGISRADNGRQDNGRQDNGRLDTDRGDGGRVDHAPWRAGWAGWPIDDRATRRVPAERSSEPTWTPPPRAQDPAPAAAAPPAASAPDPSATVPAAPGSDRPALDEEGNALPRRRSGRDSRPGTDTAPPSVDAPAAPFSADSLSADSFAAAPFSADPLSADPLSAPPFPATPFSAPPFPAAPFSAAPSRAAAPDRAEAYPVAARNGTASRTVDELFGPLVDLPPDTGGSWSTPIFEAVASAWFRDDPLAGTALAPHTEPLDWESPGDDEWRAAAERAARSEESSAGELTPHGLPRRRPGGRLVQQPVAQVDPPEQPGRLPDRVRERLSGYQRGLQQGRHRADRAEPTDPMVW